MFSCEKPEKAHSYNTLPLRTQQVQTDRNVTADIEDYMAILSLDSPQAPQPREDKKSESGFYYQCWESGVNQIYRKSGDTATMVTSAAEFPEGTDFYSLSPYGDYMVIGADVGGDEQFNLYIKELRDNSAAIPFDTGRESRADNPLWYYENIKPCLAYRSTARNGRDFDFYSYCPQDGKKRLLKEMSGYNWITDVRDARLLYTRYMGGNLADIYLLDTATKQERRLSPENRKDGFYGSARFAADGGVFYLTDDGLDFQTLFRLDLQSGQTHRISMENWPIEDFELDDFSGVGAYIYNENGVSRLVLFNSSSFEIINRPNPGSGLISQLYFAGGRLYFVYADPVQTTDIYSARLFDGGLDRHTALGYGKVNPTNFVRPELVSYTSFDGRQIPAFLYRPAGNDKGPMPYIIYAHGGPEEQFRPGFVRNVQYFLERGIGMLAPNVRGSSGYTREYLALDNREKRMDSIKDYKAAADWLLAGGLADPEKLGIDGGSYGGYVVLASITEYPELFAAAVSTVGIVNFITYFQKTKGYRQDVRAREYGDPEDVEFLKSISPIFKIDRVRTPLLIIHGANDPRVPVEEALQIETELKKLNQKVQTLIFSDEGHGINKLENRLKAYRVKADFFIREFKLDAGEM